MGMTLADCPSWPRYLTREVAATYLGVSVDVFDNEVRNGIWPAAFRRGGRGGKLTWDKRLIDAAADRVSGLSDQAMVVGGPVAADPPSPALDAAEEDRRIHAAFPQKRVERRTQKAC
jgi:hypothetical protein